jgi:hypothetical protein
MYTHVSKCKNIKIKGEKNLNMEVRDGGSQRCKA